MLAQSQITYYMNPSEGDFTESDPSMSSASARPWKVTDGSSGIQRASNTAAETWQTTKERTGVAREKTEMFLRENPVPTIVGALLVGVAIGWALRYAVAEDEEEMTVPDAWGVSALARFRCRFSGRFSSQSRRYEDSAETVKEGVERGVDRLRDIDVKRYTKPLRKRWKDWTD